MFSNSDTGASLCLTFLVSQSTSWSIMHVLSVKDTAGRGEDVVLSGVLWKNILTYVYVLIYGTQTVTEGETLYKPRGGTPNRP